MGIKMKAVFCLGTLSLLIVLALGKGSQDNLEAVEVRVLDRLTRDSIQEEGKLLSKRRKKKNTIAKKQNKNKKKKGKSARRIGKKCENSICKKDKKRRKSR